MSVAEFQYQYCKYILSWRIHVKWIQTHYLQTENISYLLKTLRWKSSTHLASKQTNNSKKKKKSSK
jgi:hypothetical protein